MMMQVLIVEDDERVARTLKDIIEVDGEHVVVGIAHDLDAALMAIARYRPQLVLIDLILSGRTTGIEVAARAREHQLAILFTTANPLPFPVPELALGCLCKPYSCYSVARTLRIIEHLLVGLPAAANADFPAELELY